MLRKILPAAIVAACAFTPTLSHADIGSGFYLGLNGGFGSGKAAYDYAETYQVGFTSISVHGAGHQKSTGFLGGGQIGYNYVCPADWFVGVETDFDATGIETDVAMVNGLESLKAGLTTPKFGTKLNYLGTARARFGYTGAGDFLLYATGGFAYGRIDPTFDVGAIQAVPAPPPAPLPKSSLRTGWTVGAGAELPLGKRFTFKAEYLYADLGRYKFINGTVPVAGIFSFTNGQLMARVNTNANILRVGIDFSLN